MSAEIGNASIRRAAMPPRRPLPIRFVVAGGIVLLAFVYLIVTGLNLGTAYYLTVGELRAGGQAARPIRVSGDVVPGSIVRDGTQVKFQIADSTGSLPVVYSGVVPDIFGDNIQVVVEGRTDTAGTFQATTLLAKCPSKFQAKTAAGPGGQG
jgi:cytochrome c-type biogenesis protein CcmE